MDHAAPGQGLMDGLLALAAPPAEAAIADPAAHDPAATAVLAEVIEGANANDQLIDTVEGGGAVRDGAEAAGFALAQLLDQNLIFEAVRGPTPTVELEHQTMAEARTPKS